MESKLPKPGARTIPSRISKLPAPSTATRLKPPTVGKRSRSPEQAPTAKRQKVASKENVAAPKRPTTGRPLKPSNSTGSLSNVTTKPKPAPGQLRRNASGSGINSRPVAAPKQTAPSKPPQSKPTKPAGGGGGGKPKRAAWDLKGRLQDMEEIVHQMSKHKERATELQTANEQLSSTVSQRLEEANRVREENQQIKSELRDTKENLDSLKRQHEQATENFEFTKASLRRQKEALEGEISALQQENTGLKTSVSQLTSSQAGLQAELDGLRLALDNSTKYGQKMDTENASLKANLEQANTELREHETVRRQLHNTIQELKGNIRVFCRVRPLLGDEALGLECIPHMNFPDDDNKALELEKLGEQNLSDTTISGLRKTGNGRYQFTFDRVFGPETTQTDVFDEISQLVQSALDGYNVCIFAYGQTGSGKTYTMEGPNNPDEATSGMIPRAVLQIFNCVKALEEKGWMYAFDASFLEIYNETIRDLVGTHDSNVKHEIKLGTNGGDVTVTNLTTVPVTRENQIMELLQTASKNRAVGETQCNERSSRSHSVFRLKISGNNSITGEVCNGTLNLVDLAGSEKLKDSGATGQRLKETQNINKSLSNLGNVIMALGNKESHIPYRNSKLTYLLQNSLGGNSKTLMFVNVSPREENFAETLNSLRFATKVNNCNIGTATKKTR